METLKLGNVPTQGFLPTEDDPNFSAVQNGQVNYLEALDAKSDDYKDSDLQYDATSNDWSFEGLGLTDDNLPLLFPDSTISAADINTLYEQAGVDSAEIPDTSTPNPTSAPYAPGTCGLDLKQSKTANTDKTGEYTLEPTMTDNDNTQIGYDSPETVVPTDPYNMQSKLEDLLEMTPSKDNHGMVKFVLGEQVWDTT